MFRYDAMSLAIRTAAHLCTWTANKLYNIYVYYIIRVYRIVRTRMTLSVARNKNYFETEYTLFQGFPKNSFFNAILYDFLQCNQLNLQRFRVIDNRIYIYILCCDILYYIICTPTRLYIIYDETLELRQYTMYLYSMNYRTSSLDFVSRETFSI